MSKPRRPYGNPPGRLPATMLKVLAAELSDSARLGRGKELWAGEAVIDLVIGRGTVTAEVQGSRRQPYVVTIETEPGEGTPHKADLWVQCTCPDDAGTGNTACKHAVAAMFALSDEIAVEPELLDRWRSGRVRQGAPAAPSRHLHVVRDDTPSQAERPGRQPVGDHTVGQIAALLAAPGGGDQAPIFPAVEPRAQPVPRGELWGAVLADALARLQVDWD